MPSPSSSLVTAMPAAPAPLIVTRSSSMRQPRILQPLISAAATTMAVPCWSSWKTGMSSGLTQLALDLEAAGRADVLEVDAAEIRGDVLDDADDLVDVARGEADRERLDPGQGLQQNRLALHHRQRGLGTDVAETEHRRAVGDDGDQVPLGGDLVDHGRVVADDVGRESAAGGT